MTRKPAPGRAYFTSFGSEAVRSAAPGRGPRVLFDASALTIRYASEPGRDRVLALFAAAGELLIAAHCGTEVACALLRCRREGSLPAAEFDRAWAGAQRDLADMVRVPLDAQVERFAFAAMERGALRAADALHVGSALVAAVDWFVTADRRQVQAARALGLQTEWLNADAVVCETRLVTA